MKTSTFQYINFLEMKLKLLEEIYKNTIQQSSALENKDYKMLENLSKVHQKNIDNFIQIMGYFKNYEGVEKNDEVIELEQDIHVLNKKIIYSIRNNKESAENEKNNITNSLKNINIGRRAIKNGYFKKMPQRYGYFIDKKIGKK